MTWNNTSHLSKINEIIPFTTLCLLEMGEKVNQLFTVRLLLHVCPSGSSCYVSRVIGKGLAPLAVTPCKVSRNFLPLFT